MLFHHFLRCLELFKGAVLGKSTGNRTILTSGFHHILPEKPGSPVRPLAPGPPGYE